MLCWLLDEPRAPEVREPLAGAELVLTSSLTIIECERVPFPAEPIRTLDAIHLATAVLARTLVPGLDFLSLDARCRRSAEQMGLRLLPGPD